MRRALSPVAECTDFPISYQDVQHLTPLATSIRFLPNVIAGSILNVTTGLLVHRLPVNYLVVAISGICAISPLLMALINPAWTWWACAFWAMLLLPIAVDGELLAIGLCMPAMLTNNP